jgi:hypothetical protein
MTYPEFRYDDIAYVSLLNIFFLGCHTVSKRGSWLLFYRFGASHTSSVLGAQVFTERNATHGCCNRVLLLCFSCVYYFSASHVFIALVLLMCLLL